MSLQSCRSIDADAWCKQVLTITVTFQIVCVVPHRPIHTELFSDYYWEGLVKEMARD